jgi:Ca2+-binding RTX toxin-like protein
MARKISHESRLFRRAPVAERLEARQLLATFTVTSILDSGPGTLRQAILDANALPGGDTIAFNLSGDSLLIAPETDLPPITEALTLDGRTQPGFSTSPVVELQGRTGQGTGLSTTAAGVSILGLSLTRWNVAIDVTSGGATVQACYIGVKPSGTVAGNVTGVKLAGNRSTIGGAGVLRNVISGNSTGRGVEIASGTGNTVTGNIIGLNPAGTASNSNAVGVQINNLAKGNVINRCVISGNTNGLVIGGDRNRVTSCFIGFSADGKSDVGNFVAGVTLNGTADDNQIGASGAGNVISGSGGPGFGTGVLVQGGAGNVLAANFIGTDASGNRPIGNGTAGVRVTSSSSLKIGSTADPVGAANRIAFNNIGIAVNGSAAGVDIHANSIFDNTGLGIDLNSDGVTNNDVRDPDSGPNALQNYPIISSITNDDTSTRVLGTISTTPNSTVRLDFYASESADPSGFGEGKTFVGTGTITTDSGGNGSFNLPTGSLLKAGTVITATATVAGNTSEFSPARIFVGSSFAGGVLTIAGGNNSDAITLTLFGPTLNVTVNALTDQYTASEVKSIEVFCAAGDDTLNVGAGIMGVYANGGEGDDILSGGDGADQLVGGPGRNTLLGNNGNDRLTGSSRQDLLEGGAGSDRLYGGGGNDVLNGGSSNDSLFGEDGDDILSGGSQNDFLDGGPGADQLNGNAGLDTASYSTRTANLFLSINGAADDGQAGERDNIGLDVETVVGGAGNDLITGSAFNNVLRGGPGNDTLTGGLGLDSLFGEGGDDTLFARDGVVDLLDGGTGTDSAQYDRGDLPRVNLEVIL